MDVVEITMSSYELFGSKGQFIMPTDEQVASMDAPTRERLMHVQAAYSANALADSDLKRAQDRGRGLGFRAS